MRRLADAVTICLVLMVLSFGWQSICKVAHALHEAIHHTATGTVLPAY